MLLDLSILSGSIFNAVKGMQAKLQASRLSSVNSITHTHYSLQVKDTLCSETSIRMTALKPIPFIY